MKHILYSVLIAANMVLAGCIFTGCTTSDWEDGQQTDTEDVQSQLETIQVNLSPSTRVALNDDGTQMVMTWTSGDKLRIGSDLSSKVFTLESGEGSSTGTFTGSSVSSFGRGYQVYYPSSLQSTTDFGKFSYEGQTQSGNNNTDHLKDFTSIYQPVSDYKSFTLGKPESGQKFYMSSCMKFVVRDLPEAIVPNKLTLVIDFSSGIDFYTTNSQYYKSISNVNMELALSDFTATREISAYRMMTSHDMTFPAETVLKLIVDGQDSAGNRVKLENRFTMPEQVLLNGGYMHILTFAGASNWTNLNEVSTDFSKDKTMGETIQEADGGVENGADIIIMGDGFIDKDIESGYYDEVMNMAYEDFFAIEPFSSLKGKFNVYTVYAVSPNRKLTDAPTDGINGAVDIPGVETRFSTAFSDNSTHTEGDSDLAFEYAKVALGTNAEERIKNALVLIMINAERYSGTCHNYYEINNEDYASASSAVAYIPLGVGNKGKDARTMRRGILHHEANGHGFGKLADEYDNLYQAPSNTQKWVELRDNYHPRGMYRNVDVCTNTINASNNPWPSVTTENVYWHSLFNTANDYETSEGLGLYEGAFTFKQGFCRPSNDSMMNHNNGGFNAPSRWAIYYRLMRLTHSTSATTLEESLDEFLAWDRTINYGDLFKGNTTRSWSNQGYLQPLAPSPFKVGKWVNGKFVEF